MGWQFLTQAKLNGQKDIVPHDSRAALIKATMHDQYQDSYDIEEQTYNEGVNQFSQKPSTTSTPPGRCPKTDH